MEIITQYFENLSTTQKERLSGLKEAYTSWNEKINVISRKDIDRLYEKHVLHSLAIAKTGVIKPGMKVIDIGTGGGFPGIPLAILYPDTQFLLVDSIGKKIKVVRDIIDRLELTNADAVQSRVENLPQHDFDLAVSRAVAALDRLWQWSRNVLRATDNQGLICLKGGDLQHEIVDSGLHPTIWPVGDFFSEPFFNEKYILWVRKQTA